MNDKQKGPLKESIDYPDFVSNFVKKKLAQLDLDTTAEMTQYISEDIEDYMLGAGKTIATLDAAEILHIEEFIKDRVAQAKDVLPAKGA